MKKILSTLCLMLVAMVCSISANAQTATGKPKFLYQKFADYAIAFTTSDNGKWAVVYGATTEQQKNGKARIVNVETGETTVVRHSSEEDDDAVGLYEIRDITDDGNTVVGAAGGVFSEGGTYTGKPAYWNKKERDWNLLPMPEGMTTGIAVSITPDGKYAVGRVEENANDAFSSSSRGIMWDMTGSEPKIVELKNLPEMPSTEGSTGKKHVQEAFTQITADGRYIVIYGNQSYGPIGYIYDRQTETYFKFGENANEGPIGNYELEGEPVFSLNGKYVAGDIRDKDDNIFPMVYNTETGKYKYFNSQEDNDLLICCIDNEGNLYGSAPGTSSPVRDWRVCVDNVWYPFDLILKQRYGIEYSDYTGYDNTGTLWSASANTKTLSSMVSPQGESYVVTMPETMTEACRAINLLNNYTATPAAGSNFSNVAVVKVTFTHEITVLGNKDCAVLKNAEGAVQRKSMGFAVDKTNPKVLIVTFRNTEMKAGEKYTVEIPAGTVALTKNTDKQNDIITINYVGRENVPVKMQSAFPENNAEIARIDNTSNPVILTFDTNISVSESAKASLVQLDGENEKTICSLSVLSNENQVALMPAASQYLYKGSQYKVVLEAGSLTDVSGSSKSANEQIVLNYTGTYERQISTSDATLFSDNFSTPDQSYKNFMRYEGDHNTPTAAMKKIGFDKDNTPWLFKAKDNKDSKNYFAASTSMYSPAGQSDDWLVIPQLSIPDAYCTLTFDAQKNLDNKNDILKVVVWECDRNINDLSSDDIAEMKAKGDVKDYELNIGDTEEGIDGEFTHYSLDLGKYAGKKVYIGFWNNNKDQSMIFLDSVVVKRNLKYLMSLSTASSVVNKKEVKIAGSIRINSQDDVYSSARFTLKDEKGTTIDTFEKTGLTLKKGKKLAFEFAKPLALTIGEATNYSIEVKLDDYTDVVKNSIKSLTFEPVKRVVLEEFTGTTCVNCPLGILAIENAKKIFGEQFIPISIHTYQGDPYGTGLYAYSNYLKLSAAPSGIVQREDLITSPMGQNDEGDWSFSAFNSLWQDRISMELDKPADMGINVPAITLDDNTRKLNFNLEIQPALNLKNQYLNVFAVALEDGIVATQSNNLYTKTDPIFGDWGKGGKYGYASVDRVVQEDMARCYWGTSFTGSSVGFPQNLTAGETYSVPVSLAYPEQVSECKNGKIVLMLFDGNTNNLINSVLVKLSTLPNGIENAVVDNNNNNCDIAAANGVVSVKANGNAKVEVYSMAGQLINTATGTNNISVSVRGYKGAAVVKVNGEKTNATKKVIL